jgi:hypothetical protein
MRKLTASDRETLIKLASNLPKGDENRKAILVGLKTANAEYDAAQDAWVHISDAEEEHLEKALVQLNKLKDKKYAQALKSILSDLSKLVKDLDGANFPDD